MHLVKAGGQEISNSFQGSLSNYRDFNLEKNGGFHKSGEGGVGVPKTDKMYQVILYKSREVLSVVFLMISNYHKSF